VSNFHVGAVVCGESGCFHLGANLEFEGQPLQATVHAEQAAISRALVAGEASVGTIHVTEMPCGHCRQFMVELGEPLPEVHVVGDRTCSVLELLPDPFAPKALGIEARPLRHASASPSPSTGHRGSPVEAARLAARASHAPYSGAPCGVAFQLRDGGIVHGCALESVAFNPGLPAMQAALVELHWRGHAPGEVVRAVIAEGEATARSYPAALTLWGALSSIPLELVSIGTAS
jgi:cytidine deaminase